MACCRICILLTVIVTVLLGLFFAGFFNKFFRPDVSTFKPGREYWRIGKPKPDNVGIRKFTPLFNDKDYNVMMNKVKSFKFVKPLEGSKFHYGFNGDFMKTLVDYWINKYDWKKWQSKINSFNHFKTEIEGLDIHYIHVKPDASAKVKIPIMLLHGWPATVFEFYKVIPLLTSKSKDGVAFEVIVPSIPGYGWSEAPGHMGFDAYETARIFSKLMSRLGFDKEGYYIQGGDWGGLIASIMVRLETAKFIKGFHSNIVAPPHSDPRYLFQLIVGSFCPSLFFSARDAQRVYPYFEKLKFILLESGYMHLQATKPDSVGHALSDSPVGLAAYILEKYGVWTNPNTKESNYGGLVANGNTKAKFTLDELLTTVIIYWSTESITSSMRYYKENMGGEKAMAYFSIPSDANFGYAAFPHDLVTTPERWVRFLYPNLIHYTDMPDGGHFAALEEPEMMSKDIREFVHKVEDHVKIKKQKGSVEL